MRDLGWVFAALMIGLGLGVVIGFFCLEREPKRERRENLVLHWCHSVGDAHPVRCSVMADGTALLIVGDCRDPQNCHVWMRDEASEWVRQETGVRK